MGRASAALRARRFAGSLARGLLSGASRLSYSLPCLALDLLGGSACFCRGSPCSFTRLPLGAALELLGLALCALHSVTHRGSFLAWLIPVLCYSQRTWPKWSVRVLYNRR